MKKINNKKFLLIFFSILILIVCIIYYFLNKKKENNIQLGPVAKGFLSGKNYIYKLSKPKRAIKFIDFREDSNAPFKVPPDPPAALDSLGDLTSITRF